MQDANSAGGANVEAPVEVGFVGLGIMGAPMALNLLAAGYSVHVHNRTPAKAEPLAEAGANVLGSPAEVAERVDVLFTCLSDTPDVREVYLGSGGVLSASRPNQLFVDTSTIAPSVAREVATAAAERGASALDAPVSGGDVGAREGTLSVMVGGDGEAFARALPLLEAIGRSVVHVGPPGAGQTAKACNQVLVARTIEAVSETLVLASAAGVDPSDLVRVLSAGMAGNRVLELRGQRMIEHDFEPGFKVSLHAKDLRIALQLASDCGVKIEGIAGIEAIFQELIAEGRGELDNSAMLRAIESRAGAELERGPGADAIGAGSSADAACARGSSGAERARGSADVPRG